MSRKQLGWYLAATVLAIVAAASAPAFSAEPETPAASGEEPSAGPGSQEGMQAVETILRQQEDLLSGQRFSYDPGGRRDPFRSLYENVAILRKGPRPKGVAGMLVTEVDLVGIVQDRNGGDIAVCMGSDNKGYFLRVGDEVYDGTLLGIDPAAGSVTFRQQVDDPRLIKPYRDVVKKLVLQEEKANE